MTTSPLKQAHNFQKVLTDLSIYSNESMLLTVGVSGRLFITESPSAFSTCIHQSMGSFLSRASFPKLSCHSLVDAVRATTAKMRQLLKHKSFKNLKFINTNFPAISKKRTEEDYFFSICKIS